MNPVTAIAIFAALIGAAAMLALPNLNRRDILFGVPIPDGFSDSETGRGAIRSYRTTVAVASAAAILFILYLGNPALNVVPLLSIAAAGTVSFVAQNRKLRPYAVQPAQVRTVNFSSDPEPLPSFIWLGIAPFLLLAGIAAYLALEWDKIPSRFPVHFDLNGTPNRWVDRSFRGVFGLPIFAAELTTLFFGIVLATWYGTRRNEPMRKPGMILMMTVEWCVTLTFAPLPLKLAAGIDLPLPLVIFGPMLLLVPAIIYAVRQSNQPRDPIDPTPNECWKGGIIYHNPADAALLVQRRDGIGFTFNTGNPWTWIILTGIVLVMASAPFVLA
jgi:uncharacterized membrane protein